MSNRSTIVVRRAEMLAGYREAGRGDALILDQMGAESGSGALGAIPFLLVASAAALAFELPMPFAAIAAASSAMLGVLVSAPRVVSIARARVTIDEGMVRVFVPATAPAPTTEIPVTDVVRVELAPMSFESDGWQLVALTRHHVSHILLETGTQVVGLRVRTLLIERLSRDGAFEGSSLVGTACPACGQRIVVLEAWLPTPSACAACGAVGTLESRPA